TELLVRASWRRQGIGQTLHDLILSRRREERATLTVLPAAAAAQNAFQSWGWQKVARTRDSRPGSRVSDVLVTALPAGRAPCPGLADAGAREPGGPWTCAGGPPYRPPGTLRRRDRRRRRAGAGVGLRARGPQPVGRAARERPGGRAAVRPEPGVCPPAGPGAGRAADDDGRQPAVARSRR